MIRVAGLVARKDLLIEWRSRVLAWQVLPFGVLALVLAGLALGPRGAAHSSAAPGLFYLVLLLVVILMVNRSVAVEQRPGTRASVQALGLDPAGVFLGKALALFVELVVASAVLLAGAVVALHTDLVGTLRAAPSVAVALAALASAGTLYGSLVGAGEGPATLLPLLTLPAFSPLLVAGERAYSAALAGQALWQWWLILLVALAAYLGLGVVLYGVVEE